MKATEMYMRSIVLILMILQALVPATAQPREVELVIDADSRFQTIDGFGVNINAAWWLDGAYRDAGVVRPAIDLLIDSLGATIFRVVIEEMDWEAVNDDPDPEHFNENYYQRVFSDARFQGVWNTLRYLNQRGIKDQLMISFMGGPPAARPLASPDPSRSWMGDTRYAIHPTMEDEFVESMAALLFYARNTEKIEFRLVSPMNETDILASTQSDAHPDGIVEGPNMPEAQQVVRIIRKLAEKLDRIGMEDILLVTPDAAGEKLFNACFDEMVKDPYLMGKIAHWGVHQYGKDAGNYLRIMGTPGNPVKSYWVTETAGIQNLMGQLDDSASAHFFWDGFDCVYQHAIRNGYGTDPPNDWVFWEGEQGKPLLAYHKEDNSWTPRKQFFEFAQFFRFIEPGAIRIGATVNGREPMVYAYRNPTGQLVITGRNNGQDTVLLRGHVSGLPPVQSFSLFMTNAHISLQQQEDIRTLDKTWMVVIPAGTLFTLVGQLD